jgi:F0F1-type ATP synthase membrane subunit b/b'
MLKAEVKESRKEVKELKAEMKEFKAEMKEFKTEVKEFITEMKEFKKDLTHAIEKQLAGYLIDQEKQFSSFYARAFFGVSLTLYIIYQFLT